MADYLLTVPQAAERLACSRWHVYALLSAGELRRKSIGLGKQPITRVVASSIDAYIRRR